jgi:hypothetical protein
VAKLPDSTIVNIFTLQRRLAECLESTTAMEFSLFQQFGETAETAPELEELVNIRERLVSLYNRLHNIFLRVTQSQPIASEDLLNLLYRSIEQSEISIDTSIASLQDIQRNWN